MVTLAEINDLVRKFGPVMRIHPDEKYLMDDPDPFLRTNKCSLEFGLISGEGEGDYDRFKATILGSMRVFSGESVLEAVARVQATPQAGDASFRYWLKIDDALKPGNLARAKALVWAKHGLNTNVLNLQFWFFYGFNGPGKFRITVGNVQTEHVEMSASGRHYGDFEHVTLVLRQAPDGWLLHKIYLSRHSQSIWVNDLSQLRFSSQHPVIYVARDSHAHYVAPGTNYYERSWSQDFGLGTMAVDLYDLTADGGTEFDSSKPGHNLVMASEYDGHNVRPPSWFQFGGRWGQYEKLQFNCEIKDVTGIRLYTYPFERVESGPKGPLQHPPSGIAGEWANPNMGQGPGAVTWFSGDFNGDRKDEIVQGWSNGSVLGLIIYGSDGFGGLKVLWANENIGQGSTAVTWLSGDFNGDGKDEIVQGWSNRSGLGLIMYGSDGAAGLKVLWGNGNTGQGPNAVTWLSGDFNGDGKDEIVQGWSNSSGLGLIMYGSDGAGGLRVIWENGNMGEGPNAVTWLVGDFNGDGKDEIVQGWSNSSGLGLIMYGSDGATGLKVLWENGNMGQGAGALTWLVGDFNGDGKDEIVQGWSNGAWLGLIMYGADGAGGLKVLWANPNTVKGASAVTWLSGDFNADGKDEIIQGWSNRAGLGMIMYGSDSAGGLTKVWAGDTGQGPGAVAWMTGDFNGRGKKAEIVQAWANSSSLGLILYSPATE